MASSFKRISERLKQRARDRQSHAAWCYLPRFLLTLLTLALLGAATWVVTWPGDGMTWVLSEGRILTVDPDGPSERAGLRPGDVVLAVDGYPLASTPLYAGKRAGQQVVLTVQRGAEIRDVTLTLVAPGTADLLWGLIPVVVAAGFWAASVVILALRPRVAVCRAFFLLGQGATVALSAGQLSAVNLVWAAHLFYLALLALPPLLAHLRVTLAAPTGRAIRAAPRWLAGLSGLLALPELAALVICGWDWPGATFPLTWPAWRAGLRLYLGLTLLTVTLGLAYTYFTTRSADLRRRLRGLAFGTAAGFTPLLFLSLLPEVVWGTGAGLPYQVAFPFLMLIPLTYAYVIVQHDLAPLDRLLNRSLVIFSLGLLWAGLYLGGVGLGMTLFRDTPLLQPLVGALVTMGMAAVFTPLRRWIQRIVDRLFYGGWYDYRTVIAQVSRALGGVASRQELAERLLQPVVEGLRLRGAALYLRAPEGELALERCLGLELPERLPVEEMTTWAEQSPSLSHLPPHDWGGPRGDAGIAQVLPLMREGRLLGLLLLGEKREDDFFAPADEEILRTLGEQAALAAENVLLMGDLRQALAALEAAQQRLLTAREEERRALAWELHDGPLQDLIALGYRLCECRDRAWLHESALAETLEKVRHEAMHIMRIVRDTCSALRSDVLDVMGLGPAMAQYAYDLMQEKGVVVYLDVPRHGPKLADPLGITLLRVFQEALSNAVEHAEVREVWVRFLLDGGEYELRVWDEGRGFAVPERLETLTLKGHFGLVTIRERMAAVDGRLEVRSALGEGTEVRVWGEVDNEQ
jgi:signal transduction histidine kinase